MSAETTIAETMIAETMIAETMIAETGNAHQDKSESGENFEPRIVGFLCNWCSYAGADKAGLAQVPYPPNVRVVKFMCSGRMDPQFVLQCYENGADGVLILACHFGDCHYKEGNFRATQRHRMLLHLLKQEGIEEARCRFDYVSAGEGDKFVQVVTEMTEAIRQLGPLHKRFIPKPKGDS